LLGSSNTFFTKNFLSDSISKNIDQKINLNNTEFFNNNTNINQNTTINLMQKVYADGSDINTDIDTYKSKTINFDIEFKKIYLGDFSKPINAKLAIKNLKQTTIANTSNATGSFKYHS